MTLSEIIEKNRNAIVIIDVQIPGLGNQVTISIKGTGFIVTPDGKFITNFHVYKEIREDELQYSGVSVPGKTDEKGITTYERYKIKPIKLDENNDVALMQIVSAKKDFLFIDDQFGDSGSIKEGEELIFIGYPLALELLGLGFGITMSTNRCIVSSVKRRGEDGSLHFFMVDTHINNGSSGSPVFSEITGKLVGIASGKISQIVQLPDGKKIDIPANMGICRPIQYAEKLIKQFNT